MAVFTFIGNWIDKQNGDQHFWILFGMFLGLFYCGYEIWKLIRQGNDDQKKVLILSDLAIKVNTIDEAKAEGVTNDGK